MPLRESAALSARESTTYLRIPGLEGLGQTEATSRAEYRTQGVAVARVLRSTSAGRAPCVRVCCISLSAFLQNGVGRKTGPRGASPHCCLGPVSQHSGFSSSLPGWAPREGHHRVPLNRGRRGSGVAEASRKTG